MTRTHLANSRRSLLTVFWTLIALLVLTTALSFVSMRGYEGIPAFLIAAAKASLVILFFMEVKTASRLTWVIVAAAFLWLGILMILTIGDYSTRGRNSASEVIVPGKMPITMPPWVGSRIKS